MNFSTKAIDQPRQLWREILRTSPPKPSINQDSYGVKFYELLNQSHRSTKTAMEECIIDVSHPSFRSTKTAMEGYWKYNKTAKKINRIYVLVGQVGIGHG